MKILIIDSHALFRDALRLVLEHSAMGFNEILEADNFYSGLLEAEKNRNIELILLEIKSSGCDSLAAVDLLHRRHPEIPIVVVSSEQCAEVINDALQKGARGFVCKNSTSKILQGALAHVLSGGIFIPPQMISQKYTATDAGRSSSSLADNRLTARQMQVLNHVAAGRSTKHVAHSMGLAEGTVRVHLASIYQTFCVNNRVQAIAVANRRGLLRLKQTSTVGRAVN